MVAPATLNLEPTGNLEAKAPSNLKVLAVALAAVISPISWLGTGWTTHLERTESVEAVSPSAG